MIYRAYVLVVLLLLAALLLVQSTPGGAAVPTPVSADLHAWDGYHLPRQSNPFVAKFAGNLDQNWADRLATTTADWSRSDVLDALVVPGDGACDLTNAPGTYDVCAEPYGATGWLGAAEARIDADGHILAGQVRINTSYVYTPGSELHAMCQEVGHILGLGHTSEDGSTQGTCMDYGPSVSTSDLNAHPNAHDYEQLRVVYGHVDGGGLPPAAEPTPVPTGTPRPPTQTPTPRPPTNTPVPPTNTPVPPTSTPLPPTATPAPPVVQPPEVPGEMRSDQCGWAITGFCSSPLFLDYWSKNGGLRQQGWPISPIFYEVSPTNGKPYYVQYFERARFEYHPENPREYVVLLGLTGREQFLAKYPNGIPLASILQATPIVTFIADPEWGALVHDHGKHAVYVRALPNGEKVVTHVNKVAP